MSVRMSTVLRLAGLAAALCAAVGVVGCGGTSAGSHGDVTKVSFLYAGPMRDDGYNQGYFETGQAIKQRLGDKVEVTNVDNVPYTDQVGKVAEQLIATGTNVIIDTGGYGQPLEDVCRAQTKVVCLLPLPQGALKANMEGYWQEWWKQEYVLGAAAGLMTRANVVGAVNPLTIPLTNSYMNSFLLGCQATNPACKMRTVTINTYYDPSASTQAANTLADAGADVLTGWVNDSSPCQVAQRRGLRAVGHYYDYASACPKAMIATGVWGGDKTYDQWFVDQVQAVHDGTFRGGGVHVIRFGAGADLSRWGSSVPQDVRRKADQIARDLETGKLDPFKGPMTDNHGKQRVPAGEKLPEHFLVSGWDWQLNGLVGG